MGKIWLSYKKENDFKNVEKLMNVLCSQNKLLAYFTPRYLVKLVHVGRTQNRHRTLEVIILYTD